MKKRMAINTLAPWGICFTILLPLAIVFFYMQTVLVLRKRFPNVLDNFATLAGLVDRVTGHFRLLLIPSPGAELESVEPILVFSDPKDVTSLARATLVSQ